MMVRDITDCHDLGQERLMAHGFPFQKSPTPGWGGRAQDTQGGEQLRDIARVVLQPPWVPAHIKLEGTR